MKSMNKMGLSIAVATSMVALLTIFLKNGIPEIHAPKNGSVPAAFSNPYSHRPTMGNAPEMSTNTAQLLFFEVMHSGEEIALTWDAMDELELVGYEIEKSMDSVHFKRIGWVYSREISRALFYEFFDKNIGPAPAFYRLKMVGFDGAMSYSDIKKPTVVYY